MEKIPLIAIVGPTAVGPTIAIKGIFSILSPKLFV